MVTSELSDKNLQRFISSLREKQGKNKLFVKLIDEKIEEAKKLVELLLGEKRKLKDK
jgi:hypothetical protein